MRVVVGCCLVGALGAARTSAADMVPEDPYTDAADPTITSPSFEPEHEIAWRWPAGIGGGLLVLARLMRRRAGARIDRETRKTQLQMCAIDPSVAQLHATVWEQGPTIVPTAIEAAMITPRRSRFAEGTGPQTPVASSAPDPVNTAPAPYPLTFPAYLAPAAAMSLPSIEPSGLHKWTPPPPRAARDPQQEREFVINFARGSQPVERLKQLRQTIVETLPADDKTRITEAPRPSDTLVMFAVRPRQR